LKRRGFQSQRGTGGYYYWLGLGLSIPTSEVKLSEADMVL